MGQRANLVVRDADGWTLHYDHWGAQTLDRDLFWGPAQAERFIRAQVEVAPDGWMTEDWCEGGALLDLPERRLLWFGGEVSHEPDAGPVLRRLLAEVWRGWEVVWCWEGLGDIVDALGVDRSRVIAPELEQLREPVFTHLSGRCDASKLITATRHGEVAAFSWLGLADRLGEYGPELLSRPGVDFSSTRSVELTGLPLGGVHIDVGGMRMSWWSLREHACETQARIQRAWPGWTVAFLEDRMSEHQELTRGWVTWPVLDLETSVRQAVAYLLADPDDPSGAARDLIQQLGVSATVNPDVDLHVRPEVSREERRSTLRDALIASGWARAAEEL